ncbi:hypothetical protein LPJ56_004239 [Coemansia sp. RSA 2599]|nr:hypothetical protein LPJ56_004239 [Coemansia sp. RSA 2599]
MKNKQRKRKFVVDLHEDSEKGSQRRFAAKQKTEPAAKTDDVLDMRITTHGKISLYAGHIASELGKKTPKTVYLYAEGPAMAKLITVLEIVKRNPPCPGSQVASELSIGNTASSPCSRRSRDVQGQGAAEAEQAPNSGIYGVKVAQKTDVDDASATALEQKPAAGAAEPDPKASAKAGASEQPWLLARLWIADSGRV